MRFRAQAASLEIESMLVFPVSRGIEWMRVFRASLEIESMPVDPDVLATTYKTFQAKLQTGDSGRIGAKKTWETFETIGKTIGAMLVIGTAIVGGTTITSIIRTIQDSVCGQVPRGRDSPTGAITAGRILSITATETTFITKMVRCTTETSRFARKPSTFSKPRRSL